MPALLEAVLTLLPLDPYVESPVTLMAVVPGDTVETPIWDTYREIIGRHEPETNGIEHIDRFDFYDRARRAFAIVATGERALYANIILKKGVVK
jgi:L-fucose mutarotase